MALKSSGRMSAWGEYGPMVAVIIGILATGYAVYGIWNVAQLKVRGIDGMATVVSRHQPVSHQSRRGWFGRGHTITYRFEDVGYGTREVVCPVSRSVYRQTRVGSTIRIRYISAPQGISIPAAQLKAGMLQYGVSLVLGVCIAFGGWMKMG